MHQQPRATEHPFALTTASRSGQRSAVSGCTVSFMRKLLPTPPLLFWPCRQQCGTARQTVRGPQLRGLVVFVDGRRGWREYDPGLLGRSEDVDVGRQAVGVVKGSNTNETNRVTGSRVVAPDGDVTL